MKASVPYGRLSGCDMLWAVFGSGAQYGSPFSSKAMTYPLLQLTSNDGFAEGAVLGDDGIAGVSEQAANSSAPTAMNSSFFTVPPRIVPPSGPSGVIVGLLDADVCVGWTGSARHRPRD